MRAVFFNFIIFREPLDVGGYVASKGEMIQVGGIVQTNSVEWLTSCIVETIGFIVYYCSSA